ncbi:unnamed protein product [Chondrus crispus]|uniref:Uncharacterized protein n=1 Tax=Chondrus crispus TaxID=2769 RepID=R7Q3Z0_CHOCR|nr:unnamed protein product [Chondrus crispus]CDF32195.1 unnamed protein product [Chondrus crispus]|eukprot:XP_005711860.1 unnamed protein product [Chondrus crispus]
MPPSSRRSTASARPAPPSYSTPSPDSLSYSHTRRLSLPRSHRDPAAWSAAFSDAAKLLLADYSLSRALSRDPDASLSSASRLAAPLLTTHEAAQYAAWERDPRIVPRVDWKKLRTSTTATTSAQKARWAVLTHALATLYKEPGLRPENCKAWVEKYPDRMSLLVAVRKTETVRGDVSAANKQGGKAKRYVHELIACRKVLGEVSKYRHEVAAGMKAINKGSMEKEEELTRRMSRLEREIPRRGGEVSDLFRERGRMYEKLLKMRKEKTEAQLSHARQQAEMNVVEGALKARMNGLERGLHRRSSGASASRR